MYDRQTLIRLDSFEPAFAVAPEERDAALRRFSTLLVEPPTGSLFGGTSFVCRATTAREETVALKRLKRDADAGSDGSDLRDRARRRAFFEEYRTQLAVAHLRGFPRLYGYATVQGEPAILMEWVEGVTLRDAVPLLPGDAGGVAGRAVADAGIAVLEILASAARLDEQLVHRDISPRNIMLRTSSRTIAEQVQSHMFDAVLIDFGSAAMPGAADDPHLTERMGIWRGGTPEYAAPEMLTRDVAQASEARDNPTVDVYALCSVLYELYCGRTPFEIARRGGASPYRVKTEAPLPELDPHHPEERELTEAILSGIRGFQDVRPTAMQLLTRLRRWRDGAGNR